MNSSSHKTVSIIGASVGGLTLALVLKRYGVSSRLFELRDQEHSFDGAVSLTPNALRVVDSIGAYSRIKPQGYNFEAMTFLTDPEHEVTGKLYFGQKDVYGYNGIRITRQVLIHELRHMVTQAGIEIHYNKKFTKVVSEDESGVEFEFADGTREKSAILVGADGIHSKVRSYLFPDIQPNYGGFLGLTYCFPRANVQLDKDFPLPVSLRGKHGSFIITPQAEGGKEIFVGRQYKYEPQDRAGWSAMLRDKKVVVDMLQRDPNAWTPLVQSVQAQASTPEAHFLNVWPFYTVPKMDRWHSSAGKVVILGDAAHAIPPSAGQGANQAFEDAYGFGRLLSTLYTKETWLDALTAWEAYRMERMDEVLRLTNRLLSLRMTEEERANIPEDMRWELDGTDAGKSQLGWLYLVDIDHDIDSLMKVLDSRT